MWRTASCLRRPFVVATASAATAATYYAQSKGSALSDTTTSSSTLYASWFCPYVQRVWIAMEEKGIPYSYVEINPYEAATAPGTYTKKALSLDEKRRRYPGFVEASPRGLVPALVCADGGDAASERKAVCDSAVLLEFLEENWPNAPALLPDLAAERAHVRYWCVFAAERIIPFYYRMLMATDDEARAAAKTQILSGLTEFARACDANGPYFMGERFGTADLWLFPWYERLVTVGAAYRGFEAPNTAEFARLEEWHAAVRARPSVVRTLADADELIANYSGYADNSATSDAAVRFRAGGSRRA